LIPLLCVDLLVSGPYMKKKICTRCQSSCPFRRDVTYGIRVGSTRDLGFAAAFVDMSWFHYDVSDRLNCVCIGNHG
jgi:hypothetical protein